LHGSEVALEKPEPSLAPLLVIGTGLLSRRVIAACERRGLPYRRVALEGPDDVLDAGGKGLDPWGAVLTTSPEYSTRANAAMATLAPLLRDLPVLAFSSDLVFDGRADRPYVESDRASATIEGDVWRRWEATLASLVPHALVIRTGPVLDPEWPEDPLAQTLGLLERGTLVRLPEEEQISPVYLPHLLDAALDFLIDRERGLWHVAPRAFCSPLELARAAAERAAVCTRGLICGGTGHPGISRGRHSRRALGSIRGWPMPDLDAALTEYVTQLRAAVAPPAQVRAG
jgi:dTDP-4-dehydrorhamnose reductase